MSRDFVIGAAVAALAIGGFVLYVLDDLIREVREFEAKFPDSAPLFIPAAWETEIPAPTTDGDDK